MPELKIHRLNCSEGRWGWPDYRNGPEWLTITEMARRYLSERRGDFAGKHATIVSINFTHDKISDQGEEFVPGMVSINYSLKPTAPKSGRRY